MIQRKVSSTKNNWSTAVIKKVSTADDKHQKKSGLLQRETSQKKCLLQKCHTKKWSTAACLNIKKSGLLQRETSQNKKCKLQKCDLKNWSTADCFDIKKKCHPTGHMGDGPSSDDTFGTTSSSEVRPRSLRTYRHSRPLALPRRLPGFGRRP